MKKREVNRRESISTAIVNKAIEMLMDRDKLKVKRIERYPGALGMDEEGGKDQKEHSKRPPQKYEKCQKVWNDNYEDYDPTDEPLYFGDLFAERNADAVAISYAMNKITRTYQRVGLPADLISAKGRALRKAAGLNEFRATKVQRPVYSIIGLLNAHACKILEEERKVARKTRSDKEYQLLRDPENKQRLAALTQQEQEHKEQRNKTAPKAKRARKRGSSHARKAKQAAREKLLNKLLPKRKDSGRVHAVGPCVAGFENAISGDLKDKLVEFQNKQPWIVDTTSTNEGRSLRCPFRPDLPVEQNEESLEESIKVQTPVVPLGQNRAVLATPAEDLDEKIFDFANELLNNYINGINFVLAQMREKKVKPEKVPKPTIGLPFDQFLRHMEGVKTQNKPVEESNGGIYEFTPVAGEVADSETSDSAAESESYEFTPLEGEDGKESVADSDTLDFAAESETSDSAEEGSVAGTGYHCNNIMLGKRKLPTESSTVAKRQKGGSAHCETEDDGSMGSCDVASFNTDQSLKTQGGSPAGVPVFVTPENKRLSQLNEDTEDCFAAESQWDSYFMSNQDLNLQINTASQYFTSYAAHQDCNDRRGHQLRSPHNKPIFSNAERPTAFPTNDRLMVLTWVLADDEMPARTALDFTQKDNGHSWMGGVITGSNFLHLQIRCNYNNTEHGTRVLVFECVPSFNGARCVITFRATMDPNREPEAYLLAAYHDGVLPSFIQENSSFVLLKDFTVTNVVTDRRKLDVPIRVEPCFDKWNYSLHYKPPEEEDILPPQPPQQSRRRVIVTPKKKFLTLSAAQRAYFHLERFPIRDVSCVKPRRTTGLNQKDGHPVYNRVVVEHGLREGKLFSVTDEKQLPCTAPLFTQNGVPMAGAAPMELSDVAVMQTVMNHTPTTMEHRHMLILSRYYKQVADLMKHILIQRAITEICLREHNPRLSLAENVEKLHGMPKMKSLYAYLHQCPLVVFGSGGSATFDGANVTELIHKRTDDSHITVGSGQKLEEPTNTALTKNFYDQSLIGVVVNNNTMFGKGDSSKTEGQEAGDSDKKKSKWDPTTKNCHAKNTQGQGKPKWEKRMEKMELECLALSTDLEAHLDESEWVDDDLKELLRGSCTGKDVQRTPLQFLGYYRVLKFEGATDGFGDVFCNKDDTQYYASEKQNFSFRSLGRLAHHLVYGLHSETDILVRLKYLFKRNEPNLYATVKASLADRRKVKASILECQELMLKQLKNKNADYLSSWPLPQLPNPDKDREAVRMIVAAEVGNSNLKLSSIKAKQFPESFIKREAILATLIRNDPSNFIDSYIEWNKEAKKKSESCSYRMSTSQAINSLYFVSWGGACRASEPSVCLSPVDQTRELCGQAPISGNTYKGMHKNDIVYSTPIHNVSKGVLQHHNEIERTARNLIAEANKNVQNVHDGIQRRAPGLQPNGLFTLERPGSGDFDIDVAATTDEEGSKAKEADKLGRGYACPQATENNISFFGHMLFKILIFRCTGNSNLLELFPEWKAQVRDPEKRYSTPENEILPRPEKTSIQEWNQFLVDSCGGKLDAPLGGFISRQHDGMIPERLKKNVREMAKFALDSFPEYLVGMDSPLHRDGVVVQELRKTLSCNWEDRKREYLLHSIVKAISFAGNYQEQRALYALAHQIAVDGETYFLDFAGATTVQSIFPGFGGREGHRLYNLAAECDDEVKKKHYEKLDKKRLDLEVEPRRLIAVADYVIERWKHSRQEREAFNVVLDVNGDLRNKLSGRLLSYTDIEHLPCCKLAISSRQCDPSRTLSRTVRCHACYCWPRQNPKEWDKELRPTFQNVRDACERLDLASLDVAPHFTPDESYFVTREELRALIQEEECNAGDKEEENDDCDEDLYLDELQALHQNYTIDGLDVG
ncbi:unknown protein [Seminavis robusta]|uniref:Uncharacterized protein n=1 Tax=Seminavis robusta TaxID=568900 RepID=A0A9N8HQ67_9STRA|nr:unknown protein [Seminavis robusta]|eukprot:Sro1138_g245360.1 n/a (1884) ;mRNA; f:12103-18257